MYIPWKQANRMLTVGIDIDANTIRLVALKKRCAITPVFELISYAHAATTFEFPSLHEAMLNALQQAGIKKKNKIVLALPYGQILTKTLRLEVTGNSAELENLVIACCEQIIAYPIDEACIDFEVLEEGSDNGITHCDVRVVIARRHAVEEKANLLAASDFSISAVDVETDALARSICYVLNQENKNHTEQITIVLHIASQKIVGLVLYQEKIMFAQELIISITDASGINTGHYLEKIKLLFPMLDLTAENLLKTIKNSDHMPVYIAEKIYVSGAAFAEEKFNLQVSQITNKLCCLANPFQSMEKKEGISKKNLEKYAPSLLISCGLAMRDCRNGY